MFWSMGDGERRFVKKGQHMMVCVKRLSVQDPLYPDFKAGPRTECGCVLKCCDLRKTRMRGKDDSKQGGTADKMIRPWQNRKVLSGTFYFIKTRS